MSLDYDIFIIDPANKDTTNEQLRGSIKDALERLDGRVADLELEIVRLKERLRKNDGD